MSVLTSNPRPEDFSAVGDGKHDDTDALQRAIASLTDGDKLICEQSYRYLVEPQMGLGAIWMPPRLYTTKPFGFMPDVGVGGLRIVGQDVVLENVRIKGKKIPAGSKLASDVANGLVIHGIDSAWKFTARGFKVSQFPHDGIHIENRPLLDSAGQPVVNPVTGKPVGTVADCWRLDTGVLTGNGWHNLAVFGSASNAGYCSDLQVELAGQDGVHDESLLGNTYSAVKAHSNGQDRPVNDRRGIVSTHLNATQEYGWFGGMYLEGDNFAVIDPPAMWVGGGDVRATNGQPAWLIPEVGGFQMGHLRVRGSKGTAPIETLIGGSGDDAITFGQIGKDKIAFRRVAGAAATPTAPAQPDYFVMVSTGHPSQPLLAFDPAGILHLPLKHVVGTDASFYNVTHGSGPPTALPLHHGDYYRVTKPQLGAPTAYVVVPDPTTGKLMWKGLARVEP